MSHPAHTHSVHCLLLMSNSATANFHVNIVSIIRKRICTPADRF